jgi:hypothetical protein
LASAVAASAAEAPAGGQSFRSPGYRFYVLLLLTFGYTLNFIDRNLLNVIQTPLINHFHLTTPPTASSTARPSRSSTP